jgi:hypothetical protein
LTPTIPGKPVPASHVPASVGPVLMRGPVGDAVLAAILGHSEDAMAMDRGAYVRVLVPQRCVLRRDDVEKILGAAFALPGDLEAVMPSFKGSLTIDEDMAVWDAAPHVPGRIP